MERGILKVERIARNETKQESKETGGNSTECDENGSDSETWTIRRDDIKRLEDFEMLTQRRMEKIR